MYAWDRTKDIDNIDVSKIEGNNFYDLISLVLSKSISKIIKKGMYKEYRSCYEETPSLKGKIKFDDSLKSNRLRNGRVFCEFDEFSNDVIHNQIIKTTLHNILKSEDISKLIKDQVMKIYHYFNNIELTRLSKTTFKNAKIYKNNKHYKLSLDICKLMYDNMITDETDGKITFKEFYREDREMAYIFENFVRNFYRRHLPKCSVRRENIRWDIVGEDIGLLPMMQTDITIEFKDKVIIMDTKYYKNTLANNMEREMFHSNNLYQIFAYLKNSESKGEKHKNSLGILLYPQVDKFLDSKYKIQNHDLKICTVNLNKDWKVIHDRLIDIVKIDEL